MSKKFMHGVGLLRISRTPVTVDHEQYVVFVHGWLVPQAFASWREAYDRFKTECDRLEVDRPHRRLPMGSGRRPGRPVGAGIYDKLAGTVDV